MKRIANIPPRERPREKLLRGNPETLSDLELLAVILGRGSGKITVFNLAKQVLATIDRGGPVPNLRELSQIPGVGPAKAALLVAAAEFMRRRVRPEGLKIKNPSDVLPLIRHFADRKQEYFISISLNGAGEVIATRVVTVGLVNQSQVHPREVFADPITDRASGIIVAHNHPSGSTYPSEADIQVTQMLIQAGKILGIQLLDHIIFTRSHHYSFLENGKMGASL